MKREHPPESGHTPAGGGKAKMKWEAEKEGEVDELLAVLGYKVKSSEMAQVAHKLEQLEQVMMCGVDDDDDDGLLSQHKVHYNPSDLSTWLESMLSDFNPSSNFSISSHPTPSSEDKNCLGVDPFSDSDLQSIPGKAILNPPSSSLYHPTTTTSSNNNTNSSGSSCVTTSRVPKRVRYDNTSSSQISPSSSRPVVVLDSQETGIRLVHTLMACAEAIQQDNLALAEALVKQIGFLSNSQVGSMKKVATYFAQALARRLYQIGNNKYEETNTLSEMLEMHFYEACPYLKFAHFTANQAILEAFAGKKKVHVIDFSMKQGMQWPALMQALALRSEGPPIFRLTGIGPPAPDNSDRLQEVGWKLAQFADSIRIQFEYRGFVVNSLTDLEAGLLDLRPDSEVVAVNSVFEMHKLLNKPGSVEKVLRMIKEVNPVLLTCVEQEASHNGSVFADRFNESLHYYSTMFDSLERCVDNEDKVMTEVYLGKQICNIVACEGVDRVERHETIAQWRIRFGSAGFVPVHLGSNAFKQASMLLDFFAGGDGYGVEENDGCLMLGWHSRPLITTSAWRLAYNSVPTPC